MKIGRIAIVALLVFALAFGAAIWWLQERFYYDEVSATEVGDVQLTGLETGLPVPVRFENFKGIDSDSSPIRFRACAMLPDISTDPGALAAYQPAENPVPLVAPRWFDCFDATAIGEALERGEAAAYLGVENIHYGIDRVWAVFADGRAYGWQQINACGAVVFDGEPAPEGCPAPPEE